MQIILYQGFSKKQRVGVGIVQIENQTFQSIQNRKNLFLRKPFHTKLPQFFNLRAFVFHHCRHANITFSEELKKFSTRARV